jgi:hypothetical protein
VIGLSARTAEALSPLSEQTGGVWADVSADGLRTVLEQTLAVTKPGLRARLLQQTLAGGTTRSFAVEAAIGRLEISALVQSNGDQPQILVTAPNGTTTAVSCRALPESTERGGQYWCFARVNGAAGTWQVRTGGTARVRYELGIDGRARTGETLLTAAVRGLAGNRISAPEPLILQLQVNGDYPVSGLAITATVTTPAGVREAVSFRDDGIAPDSVANDGSYHALYGYAGDGAYRIRAEIGSTAFSAYSTLGVQSSIGPNGEERPQQLIPLGYAFQRLAETTVIVSGAQTDDHAGSAVRELPSDGSVQYGRIERADDVDRFTVTVDADTVITLTDTAYAAQVTLTVLTADGQPVNAVPERTARGALLLLPADVNGPVTVEVRGVSGSGFYALQAGPVDE